MHVSRVGDGLAIRLPEDVVDALNIQPGDEFSITATPDGTIELRRSNPRRHFLDKMAKFNWPMPDEYRFDRDEANEA